LNGGGQIKPKSAAANKDLVGAVTNVFREYNLRRIEDNPACAHLYSNYLDGQPMSEKAQALLHTRYHAVPKLEVMNPFGIKW
jgi:hypothetical protein